MNETGSFVFCEKCGRKLLQRMENGMWLFKFGKKSDNSPLVQMAIYGSLQMSCFRRECGHINVLNFFPNVPNAPIAPIDVPKQVTAKTTTNNT